MRIIRVLAMLAGVIVVSSAGAAARADVLPPQRCDEMMIATAGGFMLDDGGCPNPPRCPHDVAYLPRPICVPFGPAIVTSPEDGVDQ